MKEIRMIPNVHELRLGIHDKHFANNNIYIYIYICVCVCVCQNDRDIK